MHGLKDQPAITVFDVDDSLGAQDVLPLLLHQRRQPAGDLAPIYGVVKGQGDAFDPVIMLVIVPIFAMVFVMVVFTILVMNMARIAMRRAEEFDPANLLPVCAYPFSRRDDTFGAVVIRRISHADPCTPSTM